MFARLLLLFTIIPAVEIYLLLELGAQIGAVNTFLVIIATGVVGAYYARAQGFQVVNRIQVSLSQGRVPARELVDGAMLLVGGALLITPGLLTDVFGISLVFPPTREFWKRYFLRWFRRRMDRGDIVMRRY